LFGQSGSATIFAGASNGSPGAHITMEMAYNKIYWAQIPAEAHPNACSAVDYPSALFYVELVPGPGILETLSKTLSEHFVEIGHFQRNFDKVFRQRSTTKLGMSLLGQALGRAGGPGFAIVRVGNRTRRGTAGQQGARGKDEQ